MPDAFSFVPLVFLLVVAAGVAIAGTVLVRGLRHRQLRRRLLSSGTRTSATVVDNEMTSYGGRGSGGGSMSFRPVVRYRTLDGRELTRPVGIGAHRSWGRGTEVEVVYDSADPSRVALVDDRGSLASIVGPVLVLLFFLGFVFFVLQMFELVEWPFGDTGDIGEERRRPRLR